MKGREKTNSTPTKKSNDEADLRDNIQEKIDIFDEADFETKRKILHAADLQFRGLKSGKVFERDADPIKDGQITKIFETSCMEDSRLQS